MYLGFLFLIAPYGVLFFRYDLGGTAKIPFSVERQMLAVIESPAHVSCIIAFSCVVPFFLEQGVWEHIFLTT